MPKHRVITLKVPAVCRVEGPFATVRASHKEVVIVTPDGEPITEAELREKAERVRRRLAMRRRREGGGLPREEKPRQ